ncbi:polyketide synthase [Prauserella sp. PE36]|uniref:Acyl carrier protein n=1 Tax=Prauserella endophytica TaxID=1592324 RepID=A0ABY2RU00_9PSEU|nr:MULTISPECIES: acyl carrier protein [Prauserella]PXY23751.1 polyketide synthase [Prauserella coralliicola]RBM16792.1 polyketide synthase [Prauserella sp. PE36]TKG60513.1 acyl carrier protein [Prauserella endophytica]
MNSPDSTTVDVTPADVAAWLVERIAEYREAPAAEIDTTVPLAELGLDSVYVLSLCGDVEDKWGLVVEPTVAWDHPTIDALAVHLHGEIAS